MEKLVISDIRIILEKLKDVMVENRDYLIEIDGIMGDSDLGLTMSAAFTAASDLAVDYSDDDIGSLLSKAGMAMAKAAPSTMGTLMGTGFMRGGKALKGKSEIGLQDLYLFWDAFMTGLLDRGKAKIGDKTINDSLYPAVLVLKEESDSNSELYPAFQNALKAAEEGVEKATAMQAQFGKAAYYGEKSRGKIDPGSIVGKLLIEVFTDYFKKQ